MKTRLNPNEPLDAAPGSANGEPRIYPCADCEILRTKSEGGTIFTVCDECWDRGKRDRAAAHSPNDNKISHPAEGARGNKRKVEP